MGTFRILTTSLSCLRCGAAHSVGVQFKTGDDYAMPEYQVGDVAQDVAPGSYEGIADAYCTSCQSRWIADEKHVQFELLADDVAVGRVVARRATWRHGALDGRPELGLVVTVDDEAPMSYDAVLALAETPEGFGQPSFTARLYSAGVALWLGQVRLVPGDDSVLGESTRWWKSRYDAVATRLRALGWPNKGDEWIDVTVLVDADHRVRLAPDA
jgi:hypothetical protein